MAVQVFIKCCYLSVLVWFVVGLFNVMTLLHDFTFRKAGIKDKFSDVFFAILLGPFHSRWYF